MSALLGNKSKHTPVLVNEFINAVSPVKGTWVDCTFGAGGYSRALLGAGAEKVIGIDKDPNILNYSENFKEKFGYKARLVWGSFSSLSAIIPKYCVGKVSGVVFDLGVSSMQLDQADRGFSFQRDGPLDMRMSCEGVSAFEIVNKVDEKDLADIIFYYGEEPAARSIARAIVLERSKTPISTTMQLSKLVSRVCKKSRHRKRSPANPATRTFQALRIAVNNELVELEAGLIAAEQILSMGGLLAVVSFHSLEDRVIKHFVKERSSSRLGVNRFLPQQVAVTPTFKALFKKVIKPSQLEISENSRARSAKLRVSQKVSETCFLGDKLSRTFPNVLFKIGEH